MTGPADPVIDVNVAGRLADGVLPMLWHWQAPDGVAGAMAAAPTDPGAAPAPPGTADCMVNKNPDDQ